LTYFLCDSNMMHKVPTNCLLFFFLILAYFIQPQESYSQKGKIVHWKEMENLLADTTDSITVINFWATWCKPCVKEIPSFERARKFFVGKPVRFRYISLDFASDKKTRLDPFISKNLSGAMVWLLDETDYNAWIEKVDPTWGGSIPVTLIVNNAKKIRIFVSDELTYDQIVQKVQPYL